MPHDFPTLPVDMLIDEALVESGLTYSYYGPHYFCVWNPIIQVPDEPLEGAIQIGINAERAAVYCEHRHKYGQEWVETYTEFEFADPNFPEKMVAYLRKTLSIPISSQI
jgi:hypothetical protein